MVANDRTRSIGSDDDMPMTSHHDGVITGHTLMVDDVECPHCDFRCSSPTSMTQHSWEQHPLLMRRKKHLITSPRVNSHTDDAMYESSKPETSAPPVHRTAQQMENCKLSAESASAIPSERLENSSTEAAMAYRNNAMRSLSLLSTAAAILEQQSQQSPQRHIAVVKPQPVETHQLPRQYPVQPIYAPVYNAFIPALNQYITLPLQMAPGIPNPAIMNPTVDNVMTGYLHTQQSPNTQFTPALSYLPPQNPAQQTPSAQNIPEPARQTSDEIRTLLQTNIASRKMAPQSQPYIEPPVAKILQPMETSPSTIQEPPLEKDRVQALEKAILSMDCCDINDRSTKMPFKCPDGVWRMVSFKCIKGLWVVQTPDSATPTVYVPCDGDKMATNSARSEMRKAGRILSEGSGHKRKLSDCLRSNLPVEAKRSCASAPVPSAKAENVQREAKMPLRRTLSNSFITTKSLPAPSQQFTNNEGKRVNISMIRRNSSGKSSSCSLIKSLLLRKPSQIKPTVTSHPKAHSVTSQLRNSELQCKSASGRQLARNVNLPPLSKSSMAY